MSAPRDDERPSSDAAAQRRWIIGLCITVAFGLFGAVMAWLAYSDRAPPPASSPGAGPEAPAAPGSPAPRGHGNDKPGK